MYVWWYIDFVSYVDVVVVSQIDGLLFLFLYILFLFLLSESNDNVLPERWIANGLVD